MSAYEPPTRLRGLKDDGDRDPPTEADGYHSPDNDEDAALDRRQPRDERESYRDSDDIDSLRVGHPASPDVARAVSAAVKRYYAVAATGDGSRACSMLPRGFAASVPVDYGRYGPPYLHGSKTCAEAASRQFRHDRSQLTATIFITAVHVGEEGRAFALFGSRTTPASFIATVLERGVWKVDALMGRPEP